MFFFILFILFSSAARRSGQKKIDSCPFKVLQAPHDPAVWVPFLFFFLFFFPSHTNLDNNSG